MIRKDEKTTVIESNRTHETDTGAETRLGDIVRQVAGRGGKILIPSFAVGRTQELVYSLHQLFRSGQIPGIPIFVDSPLAVDATAVFRLHPDLFDRDEHLIERTTALFDFPLVQYVRDVSDSKKLNGMPGPAIIIAASGMAESGRILHHLANHVGDHKTLVLFVGFQGEHTLGRRLQDGARVIKVFGEEFPVRAAIETIGGYSAHADRHELRAWVRRVQGPIHRAFVVHGEPEARTAMAQLLREEGVRRVDLPNLGESYELA